MDVHSVSRPLPPIPITDAISVPPIVRANPIRFHRVSLPPPPRESPPPPLSPPLSPIIRPPSFHQGILPLIRAGSEGPRSPQPSRITSRPRVPRMGTSVTPTQSPSLVTNALGSKTEFVPTVRLRARSVSGPSPIQSLLSSARVTSNTVSSDLRRIFRRPSYRPDSAIDKRMETVNPGRLTPISERTNTSSPSTKQSYFSDYSLSDSELSDATETTNLSLTWPLSRSQTDLSNKLYRPYAKINNLESTGESKQDVPRMDPPRSSETRSPAVPVPLESTDQMMLPPNEVAELRQWMTEIDQDEIMRRFKRMRMVTMTARRWTIKRRPDGTRYLAYRRSHGSRCRHHSNEPTSEVVNTQTDELGCSGRSNKLSIDTPDNWTKPKSESSPPPPPSALQIYAGSSPGESTVPEHENRRRRPRSHRSGQCPSQPSTTSPNSASRPESFPPSATLHGRSAHRSSPRDEIQRRVSVSRSTRPADNTSTNMHTASVNSTSRSTHRRGRHRVRRVDGFHEISARVGRNASCRLHRAPDTRPETVLTGERTYVYYLTTHPGGGGASTRSHERVRDLSFSPLYPLSSRSRADSADSDSTKLITMLVV
ncbi:unnamed protein product [Echinostoma caproni]|uniref:Flocculation protein FLO11-like n=1 Tax=Echinostoma caproni TaxID=27848 RepID=A0A183ADE4_9TREM|nr:unnamed protein product [Echinostoma caproni]